jgi:ABC-type glycerol-3-phosphate transport system permease component
MTGKARRLYEPRHLPPISRRQFARRMLNHFVVASGFVGLSLLIGMAGYAYYEHLGWQDAFLNAAMLLGGMGPVEAPQSFAGKLFAGLYALYAGLVFLVAFAILIAPAFHRMLHKFHYPADHAS